MNLEDNNEIALNISLHCPRKRATYLKSMQKSNNKTNIEYLNKDILYGNIIPIKTEFNYSKFNKDKKILVIEPHCDDGVFAIGGSILKYLKFGYDIESICVFSMGGEIEKIRHKENKYVWEYLLKSSVCFLQFLDAPYRGFRIPDNTSISQDMDTLKEVIKELRKVIDKKTRYYYWTFKYWTTY